MRLSGTNLIRSLTPVDKLGSLLLHPESPTKLSGRLIHRCTFAQQTHIIVLFDVIALFLSLSLIKPFLGAGSLRRSLPTGGSAKGTLDAEKGDHIGKNMEGSPGETGIFNSTFCFSLGPHQSSQSCCHHNIFALFVVKLCVVDTMYNFLLPGTPSHTLHRIVLLQQ